MNELKPEDVMRALECCDKGSRCFCDCDNCPYYGCDVPCKDKLHKEALALLREKDAEIERLKSHLDYKCVYGYDGEVMEYCVQGPCPHYETVSQVRAEAITEFAERAKRRLPIISPSVFDQIAKEMKEGENA